MGEIENLTYDPGETVGATFVSCSFTVLAGCFCIQAVLFAFLTKIFAIQQGLLPDDVRFRRVFRFVNLESGLLIGFGTSLIGLAGSLSAVYSWQSQMFGPLDPIRVLRIAIPSATALTLGFEIILASFFFSVLGLNVRRY